VGALSEKVEKKKGWLQVGTWWELGGKGRGGELLYYLSASEQV
jgi:hypothetical protein